MSRKKNIPHHVAIIPDGNRRWAHARDLTTLAGHKRGYDRAIEVGEYALESGVKYLTLWAFSTENWRRSKVEVSYLMKLLLELIEKDTDRLHKKNIRFKVIGTKKKLSKKMLSAIAAAEQKTKRNTGGVFVLAFNYGGRQELVEALEDLTKNRESVTEKNIEKHLYTTGIPDPDLIIRTSGEQRLSGFLPWQAVYAELYFVKKHWPAFTKRDFKRALEVYSGRKRRFGGN